MKLTLPFLLQIQGSPKPDGQAADDTQTSADLPGRRQGLGGWVATTLKQLAAQISAGYHTEHNDNDTHKSSITLDGVPMGLWSDMSAAQAGFAGYDAMTLTNVSVTTLVYTIINRLMIVSFYFTATAGGTPSPYLLFNIPENRRAMHLMYSACGVGDGGTNSNGIAFVGAWPTLPKIGIQKLGGGNFTAGAVSAYGTIAFEVTAAA